MKTQEFLRRLRKYAKNNSLELFLDRSRGKGDHGIVEIEEGRTTAILARRELRTGTMKAICKAIGH